MAIGVIAFAFVALLGLLPTGLQVFRESIDSANEMWIAQNLNSMVQVTSWSKIEELEDIVFFFDEEGRMTDRMLSADGDAADEATKLKRIYAVKLLIAKPSRPGEKGSGEGGEPNEFSENVVRVIAVVAPYVKPKAMEEFNAVTNVDDLKRLPKNSSLKSRAFLVSRMDSMREA